MSTLAVIAAARVWGRLAVVLSVWCLAAHAAWAAQEPPRPRPRVDLYGDPLPDGAVARLGSTRWRLHESPLAFSPDGRYAIASGEKTRLVDATTGNTLRVFPGPSWRAWFADNKTVILPQ